ncbi:hypothetical protein FOA52_003107 [Chlamydomonas sp. UWO 241]|nr:hypothetical protein FOA52_003107 [Chlamydomonas sp. UWO 241]
MASAFDGATRRDESPAFSFGDASPAGGMHGGRHLHGAHGAVRRKGRGGQSQQASPAAAAPTARTSAPPYSWGSIPLTTWGTPTQPVSANSREASHTSSSTGGGGGGGWPPSPEAAQHNTTGLPFENWAEDRLGGGGEAQPLGGSGVGGAAQQAPDSPTWPSRGPTSPASADAPQAHGTGSAAEAAFRVNMAALGGRFSGVNLGKGSSPSGHAQPGAGASGSAQGAKQGGRWGGARQAKKQHSESGRGGASGGSGARGRSGGGGGGGGSGDSRSPEFSPGPSSSSGGGGGGATPAAAAQGSDGKRFGFGAQSPSPSTSPPMPSPGLQAAATVAGGFGFWALSSASPPSFSFGASSAGAAPASPSGPAAAAAEAAGFVAPPPFGSAATTGAATPPAFGHADHGAGAEAFSRGTLGGFAPHPTATPAQTGSWSSPGGSSATGAFGYFGGVPTPGSSAAPSPSPGDAGAGAFGAGDASPPAPGFSPFGFAPAQPLPAGFPQWPSPAPTSAAPRAESSPGAGAFASAFTGGGQPVTAAAEAAFYDPFSRALVGRGATSPAAPAPGATPPAAAAAAAAAVPAPAADGWSVPEEGGTPTGKGATTPKSSSGTRAARAKARRAQARSTGDAPTAATATAAAAAAGQASGGRGGSSSAAAKGTAAAAAAARLVPLHVRRAQEAAAPLQPQPQAPPQPAPPQPAPAGTPEQLPQRQADTPGFQFRSAGASNPALAEMLASFSKLLEQTSAVKGQQDLDRAALIIAQRKAEREQAAAAAAAVAAAAAAQAQMQAQQRRQAWQQPQQQQQDREQAAAAAGAAVAAAAQAQAKTQTEQRRQVWQQAQQQQQQQQQQAQQQPQKQQQQQRWQHGWQEPRHTAASSSSEDVPEEEEELDAAAIAGMHKEAGNASYKAGRYTQAEVSYTLAISVLTATLPVPPASASAASAPPLLGQPCKLAASVRSAMAESALDPELRPTLAVLFNNRAGARLMGRLPLTAADDATLAMELDPRYVRAAMRAATAQLATGDVAAARKTLDATMDRVSPRSQHWAEVLALATTAERCATVLASARRALIVGDTPTQDALVELIAQLDEVASHMSSSEELAALQSRALLSAGSLASIPTALVVGHQHAKGTLEAVPWRLWTRAQHSNPASPIAQDPAAGTSPSTTPEWGPKPCDSSARKAKALYVAPRPDNLPSTTGPTSATTITPSGPAYSTRSKSAMPDRVGAITSYRLNAHEMFTSAQFMSVVKTLYEKAIKAHAEDPAITPPELAAILEARRLPPKWTTLASYHTGDLSGALSAVEQLQRVLSSAAVTETSKGNESSNGVGDSDSDVSAPASDGSALPSAHAAADTSGGTVSVTVSAAATACRHCRAPRAPHAPPLTPCAVCARLLVPAASAAARVPETSAALTHTHTHICTLLDLKERGNEAVKSKKLDDAVKAYSDALKLGGSCAYAAVLHSNRAAAHQGLGNVMEALADCARSRALDPSYVRAHTRMAALLVAARCHDGAAALLTPLLAPVALRGREAAGAGAAAAASRVTSEERKGITEQLTAAKAAAKRQKTADHYTLLSIQRGCGDDDVKKAYRKAALRYHPDKAMPSCVFHVDLTCAGSPGSAASMVACGLQVEARVRAEATALFNLINKANEELADATRRRRVDQLLDAEARVAAPRSQAPHGYPSYYERESYYDFFGRGAYPGGASSGRGGSYGYGAPPPRGGSRGGQSYGSSSHYYDPYGDRADTDDE